jgi:ribulose-5-phosphate 4-epimerase/fuculose-1-phosphate aldolase
VSAAHSHSVYGKAWSALHRPLDPLTQDACAFYEDHAVFEDYSGAVLDIDEGKRLAHALGPCKAAVLVNHGLLTVGQTVDEAAWWFVTMERACQVQLAAEAAGDPVLIGHDVARKTAQQTGGHRTGWSQFQPLFDFIVAREPDLLDE